MKSAISKQTPAAAIPKNKVQHWQNKQNARGDVVKTREFNAAIECWETLKRETV